MGIVNKLRIFLFPAAAEAVGDFRINVLLMPVPISGAILNENLYMVLKPLLYNVSG